MNTYTITEKQNFNSVREPSLTAEFKDLAAAKRAATKNQAFFGTVLVIECEGVEVARKAKNKWVNV